MLPRWPYGPFYAAFDRPKHRDALEALDGVLCPSEALAAYVVETSGVAGVFAPYASYGYFESAPPAPPPRPRRPPFDVLCVSPAGPKGLALLLAVAEALPDVSFACVSTRWTSASAAFAVAALDNARLLDATRDRGALYRLARVLFVPSLWPEAFGIVAAEAGLHGVPCVSTASGGLPEANPCASLCVEADLVYDCLRSELRHGATLATERAAWRHVEADWADVNDVEPSKPPPGWVWRDNPARPGTPHDYDVGSTLFAAATAGTVRDGKVEGAMLGLAHARRTRGELSPDEAAVEARLAAYLDPCFLDALGLGVADASKLFAKATPDEAAPFARKIGRLLDDAAFYDAAAAEAAATARARVDAHAGTLLERILPDLK